MSWVLGQLIGRMISGPIQRLYKGTQIIGSGDLGYKVGLSSKDEVGELSRAFDVMASNLKNTTASVTVLNKEIAQRERVEEILRQKKRQNRRNLIYSHPILSGRTDFY